MRVYKKITNITITISIVSFIIAFILKFFISCIDTEFWVDVCLGIFSGAILTVLTSIVSYHYEKRKTLENFVYDTLRIIKFLNKYQNDFSLEQKVQFFIDYSDLDKYSLDSDFGNMAFFFDKITGNRKYIYDKIYCPILELNKAVEKHAWQFRLHVLGSGKNDKVMEVFIEEIEPYFMQKVEKNIPTEYNEDNVPISYCKVTNNSKKLIEDVYKELYGHYYTIMYGKRLSKKITEEEDNG